MTEYERLAIIETTLQEPAIHTPDEIRSTLLMEGYGWFGAGVRKEHRVSLEAVPGCRDECQVFRREDTSEERRKLPAVEEDLFPVTQDVVPATLGIGESTGIDTV